MIAVQLIALRERAVEASELAPAPQIDRAPETVLALDDESAARLGLGIVRRAVGAVVSLVDVAGRRDIRALVGFLHPAEAEPAGTR